MSDMCVIVPTRGRPESVKRLVNAWAHTGATAALLFGMDDDDETFTDEVCDDLINRTLQLGVDVDVKSDDRTNMIGTLNALALRAADRYDILGFMGDDHLPRTEHWDDRIRSVLRSTGIAYGNDLFQGQHLPTAVFMTADIIRTLGYMAPPTLHHLHADNCWRDWGQGIRRYSYLPECIIEHLHPQAGKAEWDEGHIRVNSGQMWEHDAEAYRVYMAEQEPTDIAKLRTLI